jgi:acyl-CoA synthetase (AMP-forming)/AMP-acid ligase II
VSLELYFDEMSLSVPYFSGQTRLLLLTGESLGLPLLGVIDTCRWFRTGDEVKITENGELFITGRLKVFLSTTCPVEDVERFW